MVREETERRIAIIIARRKMLSKNIPTCSRCLEKHQIQMVEWVYCIPAKWQCRSCGYVFDFEPITEG